LLINNKRSNKDKKQNVNLPDGPYGQRRNDRNDSFDVSFAFGLVAAFLIFLVGMFLIRGSLKDLFLFLGYNGTLLMLWLNIVMMMRFTGSWTAVVCGVCGVVVLVVLAETAMRKTMGRHLLSPRE
jgi:hypothetical protein